MYGRLALCFCPWRGLGRPPPGPSQPTPPLAGAPPGLGVRQSHACAVFCPGWFLVLTRRCEISSSGVFLYVVRVPCFLMYNSVLNVINSSVSLIANQTPLAPPGFICSLLPDPPGLTSYLEGAHTLPPGFQFWKNRVGPREPPSASVPRLPDLGPRSFQVGSRLGVYGLASAQVHG